MELETEPEAMELGLATEPVGPGTEPGMEPEPVETEPVAMEAATSLSSRIS
jgi:hypothetical protein